MVFVLWEILIPLIIAFAVGVLFGWLIWGWRRTKIQYSEWETMRQKASRTSSTEAQQEIRELTSELASTSARVDELQAEIDGHECVAPDAELPTGVLGVSGAGAPEGAATHEASTDEGPPVQAAPADSSDQHPYGPGSHAPLENKREQPDGYTIKGNVDSMLYHRPDSRNYGATVAEVWFDNAESAENNGFTLSPTHPKP